MALSPLCFNFKEVEHSIHKHLSSKGGIIAQASFYLLCKMDVHRTYHEGIRKIGRDIGVSCQTIRTVIGRMIKLGLIEVCDVGRNKNIIHVNIPIEVYGD